MIKEMFAKVTGKALARALKKRVLKDAQAGNADMCKNVTHRSLSS